MTAPKGKLIPIGGSETKSPTDQNATSDLRPTSFFESGILAEILHEIKGADSRIEVIPAASGVPQEMARAYREAFHKLGCKQVHVLTFDTPTDADRPANLKRIEEADGVLFTGGDQTKLIDTLLDTRLLARLQERYRNEDFVIAGTSAGAAAMPRLAIKEGKSGESLLKGLIETEKGLSLLPEAIIDTHFMQRSRLPRLIEALLRNPGLLGIGLCRDSGVVISGGNLMRAIGSGNVFIVDAEGLTTTNYSQVAELEPIYVNNLRINILAKGASYFLNDRIFTRTP